jgi:streptomycin 6-kinase
LPEQIADLCTAWGLDAGAVLGGGSESCVVDVTTDAGERAVLKIPIGGTEQTRFEARTLLAANGEGYAKALRYDVASGALLLERLGAPLSTLGLSIDEQMAHICRTLLAAWKTPPPPEHIPTGAEKAADLARFVELKWQEQNQPCASHTVAVALRYCEERADAFDRDAAVLAHGDPHAVNTLLAPKSGYGKHDALEFKLVDPDGLFIEPAYDLAILMRDWAAELLRGDTLALGERRRDRLADLTGVAPGPIWQWGFIERVSTGLHLKELGFDEEAAEYLTVADAWARSA